MSQRTDALATEMESLYGALERAIEGCSDDEWRRGCSGEGWPVGVTARHIAVSNEGVASLVQAIATGQPVPPLTTEMLDARNASDAVEHANTTRDEVLALHRRGALAAIGAERQLSDEQLDRTAPLALLGGAETSTQQLIEAALIGHPTEHLNSIRTALSR